MTPGQAAYERFRSDFPRIKLYTWKNCGETTQNRWEAIAQAAIDAYWDGMKWITWKSRHDQATRKDSQDAGVVREAERSVCEDDEEEAGSETRAPALPRHN